MSSAVATSPEKKSFPVVGERSNTSSTPNRYPYAIKTTSSAILTRSNSTGYAASHQHVYIPNTPSPGGTTAKHRHSKSDLSRPSPRPLPIPPSLESSPTKNYKGHGYTSSEELVFPSVSVRARADTLPSTPNPPPPSPVKVDELPSNPRVWTTSQLASYLITALRVRSGEVLPLPLQVAKDIAAFVKEARLNGRSFLRLNEQDLESMGINNLWREALLNASRNLRQNVLKGRIWGIEDDANESSRVLPYRNCFNSSSSSIDEISGSQESTPNKTNERKGRVRGLIASLERTSSSGSSFSNHGSSTSEGDVIPSAWADEEAAFASGSEASDIEDRNSRKYAKRPLPVPTVPPVDVLHAKHGSDEVASREAEPSVEDLLNSNSFSMSDSWGAKAWEDINIGETVKRISPENEDKMSGTHGDIFEHYGNSRSGSGKTSDARKAETHKQIRDIFARPLPSRPLPSPAKSSVPSPILSTSPFRVVEKVDRSTQTNVEVPEPAAARTDDRDADAAVSDDPDSLEKALSLLEQFRKRIAEVEEKLSILEQKDAEQAHVEHRSQGIGTDTHPASAPAPVPVPVISMESRSIQVEVHQESMEPGSPSEKSKLTQTDGAAGTIECSSASTPISQHSSASVQDSDHLVSPHPDDGSDWRRYFDGHEWDPIENGIRSYVLMVGFGVCAVVLSTILKRLAGKKP